MKVSKLLGLCFAILAIFVFAISPVFAGGGAEDPWGEDEGGSGTTNTGGQGSEEDPLDPTGTFESSTFFGSDLWYLGLIWDEIVGGTTETTVSAPDNTGNEVFDNETNDTAH